jgi:hypothetical protein
MTELEILQDAVRRLEDARVDYMVTGSIALSYYAQPRMTRDVDLVVECGGRDAREIAALFRPDYYVSDEDVTRALRDAAMFNILHLEAVVKLDFIVRKQTPFRAHEFARRQRVTLPGFQVWMVGEEDLIPDRWRSYSVNDTSREFELMVAERYAGMLPEERVRIAAEMFDTARQLVLASFPTGLPPAEVRRRLCRRFYGELADSAFS